MNKKITLIIILIIVITVAIVIAIFGGKKKIYETQNYSIKDYKYFVLYAKDKNVGVVDKEGNIVINPEYTDIYIPNPKKDVFICFKDKTSKIVNGQNEEIFKEYGDVSALVTSDENSLDFEKEVLKFRQNDLYGLIDLDGNKVLDASYQDIQSVENRPGRILVKKDDLYGVVDSKGTTLIPINYYSIKGDEYNTETNGYLNTGYIVSKRTTSGIMYGYIDYKGKKLLDEKFDLISRVLKENSDIYLIATENGRKGIFRNGAKIIDTVYQDILFSGTSNIFIVNKNGKYGFFNLDGRQILQNLYESYEIAGKYIVVEQEGKKSLFDINGNFIEQKNYRKIIEVENSNYIIAVDNTDNSYSIISKEVNIKNNYQYISYLFDDYFTFTNQEGKCGIINAKKGEVVEPKYDIIIQVADINAIEAKTNADGVSTFFSNKLAKISEFTYPVVEKVEEGFVSIYNYEDRIYIDKEGKIVDSLQVYPNKKLHAFKEDGQWGYKDNFGNIVIPAEYDTATEINGLGYAGIMKNGLWGVVDNTGVVLVEPQYEIETYYYPKFVGKYLIEQAETVYVMEI